MIEFFFQTRYDWPHENESDDGAMVEKGHVHIKVNRGKLTLMGLRL